MFYPIGPRTKNRLRRGRLKLDSDLSLLIRDFAPSRKQAISHTTVAILDLTNETLMSVQSVRAISQNWSRGKSIKLTDGRPYAQSQF